MMIYSNASLVTHEVKLPSMPEGYEWNVRNTATGDAYLELVLDGEATDFSRKLLMPDVVDNAEQAKIVTRAASSIRWDFVIAYTEEYMAEDVDADNIIHAEKRFPLSAS